MERSISVALAGDTMLGRGMNEVFRRSGATYPWGNVSPLLQEADVTIVNLECVIAETGEPWRPDSKVFHFRSDPVATDALHAAGIDCVTIANNHVLDYGQDALMEMLRLFDAAGIRHAGAGRNLEEARRPALLESHGITVAVIAATDNEPEWLATADRPGTNWLPISMEDRVLTPLGDAIQTCRTQGADLIIFSNHWGPNMVERPSPRFREFARAVIDAGADVYFGHSAHLFQGIELYRGRPIFYDAGDFVDDYAIDPHLRNDHALLFRLDITPSSIERIELIPLIISRCQVNVAEGSEKRTIGERIRRLAAEFQTDICWRDTTLDVSLGKSSRAVATRAER